MKKAATILYLVASIVGFFGGAVILTLAPIFTVIGAIRAFDTAPDLTPKDAEMANYIFLVLGISFFFLAVLYVVASIIALKARKNLVKDAGGIGIHVASIVFGVLTAEPLLIVPAIFACCLGDPKPEQKVIEGEAKE